MSQAHDISTAVRSPPTVNVFGIVSESWLDSCFDSSEFLLMKFLISDSVILLATVDIVYKFQ